MHVVSPPRVDSGTAGRPVSKPASASETAAGGGCGPLGEGAASEATPASPASGTGACSPAVYLASPSTLTLSSSAAASSASSAAAGASASVASGSCDGPAASAAPPFFFFFSRVRYFRAGVRGANLNDRPEAF